MKQAEGKMSVLDDLKMDDLRKNLSHAKRKEIEEPDHIGSYTCLNFGNMGVFVEVHGYHLGRNIVLKLVPTPFSASTAGTRISIQHNLAPLNMPF
ncbi:MAG TPA: hypothetical protein VEL11_06490 [Candidatus Bathyarchaeia archaeon]|nr:hypothetical protein [Candidatus Bathyarchaeia archaeon]